MRRASGARFLFLPTQRFAMGYPLPRLPALDFSLRVNERQIERARLAREDYPPSAELQMARIRSPERSVNAAPPS